MSAVHVDFDRKTATVTYDPDRVRPESLMRATTHAAHFGIATCARTAG
ncbi:MULTISPECIES: hypothetical protein [Burkholderia]|nr:MULTISPECIES: hypothetical protein [Burkholderia]